MFAIGNGVIPCLFARQGPRQLLIDPSFVLEWKIEVLLHTMYRLSKNWTDANYSGQLKEQLVLSAMQHIMDYTCVKFSLRMNNETDYLNITSEKGWVKRFNIL